MFDYTPEGVAYNQGSVAIGYLDSIDTRLKKINRSLKVLTLLGITLVIVTRKDDIKKQLKKVKGE